MTPKRNHRSQRTLGPMQTGAAVVERNKSQCILGTKVVTPKASQHEYKSDEKRKDSPADDVEERVMQRVQRMMEERL